MLQSCSKGHQYSKNSEDHNCPVCEKEKKEGRNWMAAISAPARRALESKKIKHLHQLAAYSEKEMLQLHGFGKKSIIILAELLGQESLTFKK